jgi:hypothetical protein
MLRSQIKLQNKTVSEEPYNLIMEKLNYGTASLYLIGGNIILSYGYRLGITEVKLCFWNHPINRFKKY